jgi:hypothetical protein
VSLLALTALLVGLTHGSPRTSQEPGSELTVTLLTFESGGRLWERFGHNGIWLHDSATGTDHIYDYGRFDFNAPNFFLRFAQGKMWYSMGDTNDVGRVIEFYRSQGRKIWAQELDLTPAQRLELRTFLAWNIRPENAGYAYDYYLDNCSTRIRDALDRVMGGAIRRYAEAPSGFTWREETRRLNEHKVLLYTGLMIGLGQPTDREMSRWEQMFLPIRLREHMDSVTIAGSDGAVRPVVLEARVLYEGGRWPVPAKPSNWTLRYLIVGVVVGTLLVWLSGPAARGASWRRALFLGLATLWALLAGIFGLALTWLWAFSTHVAAYQNENLFLFNLLALALAVLLPSAVRGKGWALKPARRLALVVAALAALGLLLKLLPAFHQSNLELIALALPIHTGVWLGLRNPSPS